MKVASEIFDDLFQAEVAAHKLIAVRKSKRLKGESLFEEPLTLKKKDGLENEVLKEKCSSPTSVVQELDEL